MAEASFILRAVDATRAAFASVQNSLSKLQNSSKVAGSVMKKMFNVEQIGSAFATALGLNIQNISENIARFITGQSKEVEKLQEELISLGDEAISSAAQLAKARNTDTQNLKALIISQQRLNDLLSKPAGDLKGRVEAKRAEVELNKVNLEILGLTKKVQEEADKQFQEAQARKISLLRDSQKASEDAFEQMMAAQIKLNAEFRTAKDKESAEKKSRQAIADSYKSAIDPMFDYANSLKELKSLADDGLLTELEYLKAVGLVGDKFAALNKTQETYVETLGLTSEETDRLQRSMMELQMIQEAGNLIAQGFEDAILSGQKLGEVVRSLGRDLVRLVFSQLVTQPLAAGIGGAIKSAFLPGRAIGGPVASGSPYVVGEQGPELFVPHASGTIVPNNKMGGGSGSGSGSVTVNYNIAAGVSRAELAPILEQERRRLKAEIPDMVRRGGGYRAAFA
jgi:hypothetical protein